MAHTPLVRGIRTWADPLWWAEQQLKLMTATTTYLGRVAQACTGATVVAPAETNQPEAPAARPEPAAPEPAAPEPTAPEPTAPESSVPEPEPEPEPQLPVAGWDELSLGSIRARLSRLSEADLVTLHAYEEHHSARPDVLSMLANRLIKVRQAS